MQSIPVEIPEIEGTNEFSKHQHYVAANKENNQDINVYIYRKNLNARNVIFVDRESMLQLTALKGSDGGSQFY